MKQIPVPITGRMLGGLWLESPFSDAWVQWAMDMALVGVDNLRIYELAGIGKPYQGSEIYPLVHHILQEFEYEVPDEQRIISLYITDVIDHPELYVRILKDLADRCVYLDYDSRLYTFYLLYHAKSDLAEIPDQWYWPGADRSNIDTIIHAAFQDWLDHGESTLVRPGLYPEH